MHFAKVEIKVEPGAKTPEQAHKGDAGYDISAFVEKEIVLLPGERALVGTGVKLFIPRGYECQIRSRSGLAFKKGVFVLNSPGTVDSGYIGEIRVVLQNSGQEPFVVNNGDRIAQLVFAKVTSVDFESVDDLPSSVRAADGFGSTGK